MSILKFIKNLFSSKKQAEMPVTIDLNLKNKEVYPPLENKPKEVVEAPVEAPVEVTDKSELVETPVQHSEVLPQITDAVTVVVPESVVSEEPKKTAKEIKAKAKKETPATEEKPKSKPKPKKK